jgi:hypothetical protein
MPDDADRPPQQRSPMETGSPEFAEDRTQINSLNNKRIHEEYQDLALTAARRSQVNFDNLQQVSLRALNESVDLQAQLNAKTLQSIEDSRTELETLRSQRARYSDDANYVTRYDLSNPVTTGAGDTLRSAAYTPNRAVDTASAGVSVSAEAVLAPIVATLQQMVETLATTNASIANVLAQAQPKTAS